MKKIICLVTATAIAIFFIINIGININREAKSIEIIEVKKTTEKQYVSCTGQISELDAKEVYTTGNKIVEQVYVSKGDEVKAGQLIMTVKNVSISNDSITSDIANNFNIPSDFDFSNAQEVYNALEEQANNNTIDNEETIEKIYAPSSGYVKEISVSENSNVDSNKPLMLISKNTSNLIVELSINENQISDIKVGQTVEITGVGFKNSTYYGTVENISSMAYQETNKGSNEAVVDITVKINEYGDDIKPGFTANSKIITSEKPNTIIVPYECVRAEDDGKEYVYIEKDGVIEKRYVTTGLEFEDGFEILDGLNSGEHIVQNPEKVSEKDKVVATLKRTG